MCLNKLFTGKFGTEHQWMPGKLPSHFTPLPRAHRHAHSKQIMMGKTEMFFFVVRSSSLLPPLLNSLTANTASLAESLMVY